MGVYSIAALTGAAAVEEEEVGDDMTLMGMT